MKEAFWKDKPVGLSGRKKESIVFEASDLACGDVIDRERDVGTRSLRGTAGAFCTHSTGTTATLSVGMYRLETGKQSGGLEMLRAHTMVRHVWVGHEEAVV